MTRQHSYIIERNRVNSGPLIVQQSQGARDGLGANSGTPSGRFIQASEDIPRIVERVRVSGSSESGKD